MNQDNYIQLIYKKLKREISPEEESELMVWLKELEDNQLFEKETQESWELSKEALPPIEINTQKDFQAFRQKMRSHKKKEGKAVVKPLFSRSRFLAIAAAIVLPLVAALWLFLFPKEIPMSIAQTAIGETKTITLADGSIVTLNENSTFEYPTIFDTNTRTVQLKGEAYFEVTSNPNQPFEVQVEQATIKVLGTKFNVRSLVAEKVVAVNVEEGKVQLSSQQTAERVILVKNEIGTLNLADNQLTKNTTDNKNASAWRTKNLTYKNATLSTVMQDLERLFKVKVTITNEAMQSCLLTARFTKINVQSVLDYIVKLYGMELKKMDNQTFELSNGVCK